MTLHEPLSVRGVTLKNRLLFAPVDGVFDAPYRSIAVERGIGLTCSEMIALPALVHAKKKILKKIRRHPSESPYQVQLAGHDPAGFAKAAKILQDDGLADIVDINMGCPSRLVTKSRNGVALMRDPALIREIVAQTRAATILPLTVKIRAGWDEDSRNAVEIARIAEGEGADWITVHPRTKTQAFRGHSDWAMIAAVKQAVSVPIIGNGDVTSAKKAQRMLAETGCDGIMIARGAFGKPWLIDRILRDDDAIAPSPAELCELILDHLERQCAFDGEARGPMLFRKHLAWYIKGLPNAAAFRKTAFVLEGRSEVEANIREYFRELEDAPDETV